MGSSVRKVRFTVSVSSSVNERFDKWMRQLKLTNKSEAIEEALVGWMQSKMQAQDAEFYAASAEELTADSRDWKDATTKTITRLQHD